MRKLLNAWRFYGLGQDEYKKYMEKAFIKNISSLQKTNAMVAVILFILVFVPVFVDKNLTKAMFFIETSIVASLLYIFIRCKFHKNNQKNPSKSLIYILIFLSYANVIFFGIYLGVWANPGNIAGSFLGILICALFLFNIPALFHLCLTLCSVIIFILTVIMVKSPAMWYIDIPNAVGAGIIGLVFGWYIIMNRLALASIANRMEAERNSYYDQSTIDELTLLKNRRDFMNTFQRFLTYYRQSDNFLCVAILDIDFFKDYNDYYGHPKGDECLRSIGRVLNDLRNNMNIYAARIGGEEFALLWFEKEAANVQNVASQISGMIRGLNIPHEKSDIAPYVTVSTGIYVAQCGASDDINILYNSADEALYTAKKNGRNRTIINSSDHSRIMPLREIV